MTFVDLFTALVITVFFLAGFSQAFLPVYYAWGRAEREYTSARTIHFIAETFKAECAKPDRDIERWKKTVAIAGELESYEISELRQEGIVRALKVSCVISGEPVEIIGLCAP
jgi:hypothetical protein